MTLAIILIEAQRAFHAYDKTNAYRLIMERGAGDLMSVICVFTVAVPS